MSHPEPKSTCLAFPLLKYSWAIDDATEKRSFSWAHETQEVLAVFDSFNARNEVLRVVQRDRLLLEVDLLQKSADSKSALEFGRRNRIELRPEQLPTSGIFRRIALNVAIRFNCEDNKITRIQMKFSSVQDFDSALRILQRIGCPLFNSPGETEHGHSRVNSQVDTHAKQDLKMNCNSQTKVPIPESQPRRDNPSLSMSFSQLETHNPPKTTSIPNEPAKPASVSEDLAANPKISPHHTLNQKTPEFTELNRTVPVDPLTVPDCHKFSGQPEACEDKESSKPNAMPHEYIQTNPIRHVAPVAHEELPVPAGKKDNPEDGPPRQSQEGVKCEIPPRRSLPFLRISSQDHCLNSARATSNNSSLAKGPEGAGHDDRGSIREGQVVQVDRTPLPEPEKTPKLACKSNLKRTRTSRAKPGPPRSTKPKRCKTAHDLPIARKESPSLRPLESVKESDTRRKSTRLGEASRGSPVALSTVSPLIKEPCGRRGLLTESIATGNVSDLSATSHSLLPSESALLSSAETWLKALSSHSSEFRTNYVRNAISNLIMRDDFMELCKEVEMCCQDAFTGFTTS